MVETKSVEIVDITPDKSVWEKFGKSGYSFSTAMAELIDNSITAIQEYKIKKPNLKEPLKIYIYIDKEKHKQTEQINITDEGCGMTYEVAKKALILGKSSWTIKSLGEFGIGMKASCSALGKKYTILTTSEGDNNVYKYVHDEEEWRKQSKWQEQLYKETKDDKKEHSTSVIISNLKKPIGPQKINNLKVDFAKRYQAFIKNKEIEILINGQSIVPEEQILSYGPINFDITLNSGNKIYGWYGLLKEGSDTGYYGFETYKKGKMIKCYEK
ncbi:ATP-binding protein [Candidatus Woesearchaeota archaeon]|nr:ATP-binding protein [Candidatus Woesearchaeota archaeon]